MKVESPLQDLAKGIALSGAWLLGVGLLTGLWAGAALTGVVAVRIPHLALASHLNALLGGFWLLAVAGSHPYLGYDFKQLRRLSYWIKIPAWGNWLITLIASFLGARGLGFNGDRSNDLVAVLLQVIVVIPSLIGAAVWIRGFYIPLQDQLSKGA